MASTGLSLDALQARVQGKDYAYSDAKGKSSASTVGVKIGVIVNPPVVCA